jgi:hypothetical protein
MAASAFSRLYRKVMARVLSPLGFQRKGSVFWRERDGLLHIIALDRSSFDGAFTVDVAIQPLVIPYEAFMVGLGARLDRFGQGIPHRWEVPATKPEMEQVLEQFAQTVIKSAIPWLDRFRYVQDIAEVQIKGTWGIWPVERSNAEEAAALCALDAGMFDQGKELLAQVFEKYCSNLDEAYSKAGIPVPEWARKRCQMFRELLELLEEGDLEGVRRRLEENKAYTRRALGID